MVIAGMGCYAGAFPLILPAEVGRRAHGHGKWRTNRILEADLRLSGQGHHTVIRWEKEIGLPTHGIIKREKTNINVRDCD